MSVATASAVGSVAQVSAVQVRELVPGDARRWDTFVKNCPHATFFHLSGWREVVERCFGYRTVYLYAEADGAIQGVLPLGHIKTKLFGNALISTPFCVYGGIAADTPEAGEALLDAARGRGEALGVGHVELRHMAPRSEHSEPHPLYVNFGRPFSADPDENLKDIPRKQRAMVRKGIKAGLRGEDDATVDRFFDLYSESLRNLGTPVLPRRWFRTVKDVFGDDCSVLTITRDGAPVSSVMSYHFRDQVLPYYGGGGDAARQYKANDFMYWELMTRAASRGATWFDYGRSKVDTGSYSFKKNWGFEPQPLYYEYHLVRARGVPEINPTNPRYRAFINLWQRLPLGASRILGPLLARGLA